MKEEKRNRQLAAIRAAFAASEYPVVARDQKVFEEMVEAGAGIRLRTICYLPGAQEGVKFPVILQRSCYPDNEDIYREQAVGFCQRGFAVVLQFCRGTGGSQGVFVPNENEREDGVATLRWLCRQSWAGDIGYYGCSYLALTGWVLADVLPEQVKTLYLTHYGTDRHTSAYQDGLFRHDVLTSWAMGNCGKKLEADYLESCRFRPHMEVDESLWGIHLDWYRSWIGSPNPSDPYWQGGFWKMLYDIPQKVTVPVYMAEGWYDHHLGSALNTYRNLSAQSKRHSVFNIGAWNHSFQMCIPGQKTKNAENSDIQHALAWFTAILKEGKLPEGKLRTYVIGADRWQEWKTFEISAGLRTELYLQSRPDGEKAYALAPTPADAGKLEYEYDPADPVPSHGCESMLHSMGENGSLEQPPCGWRQDVISFVSQALEAPLAIAGTVSVKLFASSTAADTAFTAKLMEVFPDGRAYNIRSGITTLAYRDHPEQRRTYTPGDVAEVSIDMWDITYQVQQGSRIRLDISSSNFPEYAVHSNYPGVWSLQEKTQKATQSLYCSAQYPSRLVLPVSEE